MCACSFRGVSGTTGRGHELGVSVLLHTEEVPPDTD